MTQLRLDLIKLLNKHSAEAASNTPDFILANYLMACLEAWNTTTQQRETWWGRDARPAETTVAEDERPDAPIDTFEAMNARIEELEVQLAGCGVAALGHKSQEPLRQGDYGWSPSYQDVLDLRAKMDAPAKTSSTISA